MIPSRLPDLTEIRRLREARGWTQDELARRASVPRATISHCERNTRRRNPELRTLVRIAEALGVPVGDLFGKPPLQLTEAMAPSRRKRPKLDEGIQKISEICATYDVPHRMFLELKDVLAAFVEVSGE